jgi:hypothetical protein
VPIGVLGLYLVMRHIPNFREDAQRPFDARGFALSGVGLSVLMLGLSALGGHLMAAPATAACVVAGAAALALYAVHARHTEHPVIDLRLLRMPTFFDAVVVGSLFRIGLGATPFLLPLLLQLGFGLDPLQSGILTCTTAIGAMFMKTLTVRILRRWGFRVVLTVNGILASLITAVAGLFTAHTPHLLIGAILLVSGCMRSLQFTSLQAIAFADIAKPDISQAASITSMAQRLSQSLGIAIGAYLLQLSSSLQGHATIVAADFWPAFVGIALISLSAPMLHLRLAREAGASVSGQAPRIDGERLGVTGPAASPDTRSSD